MNRVTPAEIKSLGDYELARDAFRKRVLEVKDVRRVRVGEHLTFLFENHDTVLYQIQEMLRVERITEPKAIAHEVATYNDLIAAPDELVATLLVEYEEAGERARMLRELVGLDRHVSLVVDGKPPCRAVFDEAQVSEQKISSVHYVRFPLGGDRAGALRGGAGAAIVVDHPRMAARTELGAAQLAALGTDLVAVAG
jgi:hypothetical protein